MKALNSRYKKRFTNKSFIISLATAISMLLLSFVINFYAGTYATNNASNSVQDIFLSNTPVVDVDVIFLYGPILFWMVVLGIGLYDPKKLPFGLKSIALFIVVRSIFITLTHIGPFPDQIFLNEEHISWMNKFTFGADLFFSAHTGLPFLMALVIWDNKFFRFLFIGTAIFFGIIVLLGHLHYSIDVLSAFFITYTIYHIAEIIFKKDKNLFDEKVEVTN